MMFFRASFFVNDVCFIRVATVIGQSKEKF